MERLTVSRDRAATPQPQQSGRERRRLRVTGVVQGVGFRPFVYRLATRLGLDGFVGNDPAGVFVEVEGLSDTLDEFTQQLRDEAPRLADVRAIDVEVLALRRGRGFTIVASDTGGGQRTALPPDVATCPSCVAELFDPTDRRHRYPFTNCTDCGPRLSIICDLPYDRPATTMAGFPLCPACAAEYADPSDRRYHAEPIACPDCGPSLSFLVEGDEPVRGTDAVLAAAQALLARGGIVAVKGIGGYHLACNAHDDDAVARLRERKGRVDKPCAVMLPTLGAIAGVAHVDGAEEQALCSAAAPIVLLCRRPDAARPLSRHVAPDNPLIGVMLPYSPLHHLLFEPVPGHSIEPPAALVMTSGNLAEEPICTDDSEAQARLGRLADAFLVHDRPIHTPVDDSVVRIVSGVVQPIRRSRGYAPVPVTLPVELAPTLAVGAELKNTFCLASGHQAWVSQHVGDMANLETLDAFAAGVEALSRMTGVSPTTVAVDRHPGYLTRRWAFDHRGADDGHGLVMPARVIEVQHHHAHVASLMCEHGLDGSEPIIGVAFDGSGFGHDDSGAMEMWGGEVLLADYRTFDRLGHLRPFPLPGGDEGVRNPCRLAIALLQELGIECPDDQPAALACDAVEIAVVRRQCRLGIGCVPTTSMGRLFDAVASLLGVRHRVTYEGQAAIQLEAVATRATRAAGSDFTVSPDGVIDPTPFVRSLVSRLADGTDAADLALGFHVAIARATRDVIRGAAHLHGDRPIGLTGGVFQNALLTQLVADLLEADGRTVLVHSVVPANDGGLSLGQAVVAGTLALDADREH